jgi:hypothetical protein
VTALWKRCPPNTTVGEILKVCADQVRLRDLQQQFGGALVRDWVSFLITAVPATLWAAADGSPINLGGEGVRFPRRA